MTKHLAYFKADLAQANDLAQEINWPVVFKNYEVIKPFLGMLASESVRPPIFKDLARKLDFIFDLPLLREERNSKLRDQALFEVCRLSGNLKASDALNYAKKLTEAGADVNFKSEQLGKTCLQAAMGNDALVKFLLDAGAVMNTEGAPLLFSSQRAETVELLLNSGAAWNSVDAAALPLELSFMKLPALKAMVEAISRAGVAIAAGGWGGKTALHHMALREEVAELSYMITCFKNIDKTTDDQRTALMYACLRTDASAVQCVRLLLDKGASVTMADENGKTALMWAVENTADRAVVAELLKRKPDLNARDKFGNTALHYCAARTEHAHLTHVIAQMLLEAGAQINATNTYGHTALMLLAQNNPKACELLVQQGADVAVADKAGHTVYGYANAKSRKVLANLTGKMNGAGDPKLSAAPVSVRVARKKATIEQIKNAMALRDELVPKIHEWISTRSKSEQRVFQDIWAEILMAAQLGSEAIQVGMEQVIPEDVDRTSSMLSGPFFVSKKYPMVKGGYPIVQLDLRLASALNGKALGDGLLQLWEMTGQGILQVRVIPREAVLPELMQPFDAARLCDQEDTFIPTWDWDSDPTKEAVKVFHSYKSVGFQTDDMDYSYDETFKDAPAALKKLAKKFNSSLARRKSYSDLQLFGSFETVQYSLLEVGKNCLFTIGYGADGSAQVFYDIGANGKVKFSTESATR